jgi:serine/threonine protein phosphatase 1
MGFNLFRQSKQRDPNPDGITRVYAIGDVHGRFDLFDDLIARINRDVCERPKVPTRIVILGDFIDRGPHSATIIDLLMRLSTEPNITVLRGNHEETMVDAVGGDHAAMDLWLAHGGLATLESFAVDVAAADPDDSRVFMELARRAIPRSVVQWIRRLPTYVQIGDHYFVHAGVKPGVPLPDQTDDDRLWIRAEFTGSDEDHGAIIVHGHTIYEDGVSMARNRIGVDTGAYRTNILSAVAIQGEQIWTVATDAKSPLNMRRVPGKPQESS